MGLEEKLPSGVLLTSVEKLVTRVPATKIVARIPRIRIGT